MLCTSIRWQSGSRGGLWGSNPRPYRMSPARCMKQVHAHFREWWNTCSLSRPAMLSEEAWLPCLGNDKTRLARFDTGVQLHRANICPGRSGLFGVSTCSVNAPNGSNLTQSLLQMICSIRPSDTCCLTAQAWSPKPAHLVTLARSYDSVPPTISKCRLYSVALVTPTPVLQSSRVTCLEHSKAFAATGVWIAPVIPSWSDGTTWSPSNTSVCSVSIIHGIEAIMGSLLEECVPHLAP